MNQNHSRQQMGYDLIIMFGVLILLSLICRLWPILLLMILGLFGAMLWLLYQSYSKVELIPMPPAVWEPEPIPTERDIKRIAFCVAQRRITEFILSEYPEAKWVWENPNAMKAIENNEAIFIILSRAGGYRRAQVLFKNLQVMGVQFCSESEQQGMSAKTPGIKMEKADTDQNKADIDQNKVLSEEADADIASEPELLAMEWLDAHIMEINALCNEGIGLKNEFLFLEAEDLPARECWEQICNLLISFGLTDVSCHENGIQINIMH